MKVVLTRVLSAAVSAALVLPGGVLAQTGAPAAPPASAAGQAGATQGANTFSQQDLDQLLAPIALYPDALLAQVLMASTYPLDVVEAARWAKANPDVKDKALEDAMQQQRWDPSVKALAAFPQVLAMMNEKLDWTQKLGDAFLAQQPAVMDTVQALRTRASKEGNLKSTPEQVVKTEVVEQKTVYVIEPAKPEVIYVPTYNPTVVYGTWWWPAYPPYYWYPPGYVAGSMFWFGAGVVAGAALWGGCHWGRNEVNINVNRYNNFNRTNISNTNWNHNVENRRGVAYRDNATAQKYNRAGNQQAVQSREAFRGRAETSRADLARPDVRQQADRAARQPSAGARDVPRAGGATARDRSAGAAGGVGAGGAATRDRSAGAAGGISAGGAATRGPSAGGGSAFSGAGNAAQSRASSARGNASRQSMSTRAAPRGGGAGGARTGGGGRGGGGRGR